MEHQTRLGPAEVARYGRGRFPVRRRLLIDPRHGHPYGSRLGKVRLVVERTHTRLHDFRPLCIRLNVAPIAIHRTKQSLLVAALPPGNASEDD